MADIVLEDTDGNSIVITDDDAANITLQDTDTPPIELETVGTPGIDGTDGVGVPVGGTTGQVLAKNSGTDYDTEWIDAGAAVDSVNGQTGIVVLDTDDISDSGSTNKYVTAAEKTKLSNLSGTNTGDQTTITGNAGTATALQTARTIGTLTGDVTTAGSSFNGTANNTNATVLATVNSNVGSFTNANITVNAKGLVTAVSNGTGGGGGSGITRSINLTAVDTSFAATASVDYVYVFTGSTTRTGTLPTAVANTNEYIIKNSGSVIMNITTTGGQTIDGSATITLTPNQAIVMYSTGSNWIIT